MDPTAGLQRYFGRDSDPTVKLSTRWVNAELHGTFRGVLSAVDIVSAVDHLVSRLGGSDAWDGAPLTVEVYTPTVTIETTVSDPWDPHAIPELVDAIRSGMEGLA